MGAKRKPVPNWAKKALQGVAYWIGHRRSLYRGYPLSEGALVAEICNLVYANLPIDHVLQCEVQYSSLLGRVAMRKAAEQGLAGLSRIDILIVRKSDQKPVFLIEVKRAIASNERINDDLWRLSLASRATKARAFLFVVSEASRPERFVDREGKSILRLRSDKARAFSYQVRHTLKAAHLFNHRDTAQYACVIEVYPL